MADFKKSVAENVMGNFFVDTTCIDCGTCRQLAPAIFAEAAEYSYVFHQPQTEVEERAATQALVCCPTGSIGTQMSNRAKQIMADFPLKIEDFVYYCGFTSPKSYGASSYFVQHPDGNWLIDSPKYLPNLIQKFRELGGIRWIFLSHSDDVGEAHRYAETFGAQRIFHREEIWAQPDTEQVIDGIDPQIIHPEFTVIPTPGHTRGHCVLLYRDRFLFTGDHLWWDPDQHRLEMPTHYYWSQAEQVRSSQKLLQYEFEWVLPGHGHSVHLPRDVMQQSLEELISRKVDLLAR
jgi:glyoxylase-like metal-dependent hydrolase (beta-lactamase superfamily II)/ferredoxin